MFSGADHDLPWNPDLGSLTSTRTRENQLAFGWNVDLR